MIYDRKLPDNTRENLKMKIPDNYNLEEELPIFEKKFRDKYNKEIEY